MSSRRRALLFSIIAFALGTPGAEAKEKIDFGNNPEAAGSARIDDIKLYYEIYGEGEPLLIIHPNGGSIFNIAPQIREFSKSHKVIAVDSRGHGRSGMGGGALTYERMADDFDHLLEHLDIESADLLGWSDGGIIGLLLAIRHPEKIRKMAIMGTNLEPEGLYPWALRWIDREEKKLVKLSKAQGSNPTIEKGLAHLNLMARQPDIPAASLSRVRSPVLVMAGDRDIVRSAHTLLIFESLPKSQLEIFAGATHMLPADDPVKFNRSVASFLDKPFKRPDTQDLIR